MSEEAMTSKRLNRLAALLVSGDRGLPAVRGLLLYGAMGLVILALVGILFSERFAGFIAWLPLALAILLGLMLLQPLSQGRGLVWLNRPVGLALVLGYLALGVLHAYVNARLFDGPQYDGAFQLFFPLARMDRGEWPGRDFFYFHGQLIPVVVYPFYKLFGGDFFAAQLAAKLIDLVMPLAYYLVFRWLGLDKGRSLLATVVLVGLLVTNRFTFGTQNPIDGIHIYALRSLIPTLYIAWLARNMARDGYTEQFRQGFFLRQAPFQAVLFVVAFYLGGEQAFYLLAAILLANLLLAGWRPVRVMLQSVWLVLLAIGLLLLTNLILFGSQKPLSYLAEISKNQTWFYGSYPNEFLHEALDFSRFRSSAYKVSAKLIVCLLGLPLLAWIAFRLLPRSARGLFYFCVVGGAYGLIGLTSLTASYAGEQYTDNAIKFMLIVLIVMLAMVSWRRHEISQSMNARRGLLSRLGGDLAAASPVLLVAMVLACTYSTLVALKVGTNLRLLRLLDTPVFMNHPDLGVRLPYYPLEIKRDERYHASQFLALAQAQGNAAAWVLYPEFTYLDGFDEGIKNLFQIRVPPADIPAKLAVGDFCAAGNQERVIVDIDRDHGNLAFGRSMLLDNDIEQVTHLNCYRKPVQDYVTLHGRRLILEQNVYDHNFSDGLSRGTRLQLRTKTEVDYRLRVGDYVTLAGQRHRILAVHPNKVVVLEGNAARYPLPFAFDDGSSFQAVYSVDPANSFSFRLPISKTERVITRVRVDGTQVLETIAAQPQVFTARTNQVVKMLGVDKARATVDLEGQLTREEVAHGLHLGAFRRADFNHIDKVPPVFQLMKGIVSAKPSAMNLAGSHIDFYFHTFSTRLLEQYLSGLKKVDPELVSTPSGRYVNNFVWYDSWLVRARWPVFEYLVSTYDPVAWSRFETFWRKGAPQASASAWQQASLIDTDGKQAVSIPTEGPPHEGDACRQTLYEVELDYVVSGWQRALPLLGSSTRHVAFIDDQLGVPLSFNPNDQRVRFPIVPSLGATRIRFDAVSPFGVDTHLEVQAVRYRRLELPAARIGALVGKPALGSCP